MTGGGFFNAVLRGKGAVAQGFQKAIALASRAAYIGGNNSGIVNPGFMVVVNQYRAGGETRMGKGELAHAVDRYLDKLQKETGRIGLFEHDGDQDASPSPQPAAVLDLDRVFVPLKMRKADSEDKGTFSCRHLLTQAKGQDLLLRAGPGQGKSVILLYLANQLARHLLTRRGWEDPKALAESLGFDTYGALSIPVYLPLNIFAEAYERLGIGMEKYLDQELQRENFGLPPDFFSALVRTDKPLTLLLDGFDEILDDNVREEVSEHLAGLAASKSNVRFIVASRRWAVRGKAAEHLRDFAVFEMDDFLPDGLERIVRHLHLALDDGTGKDAYKTKKLLKEISGLEDRRRDLDSKNRLIDSPLMASLAVQIRHATDQPLPSRSVDFLSLAIDVALNAARAPKAKERALLQTAVGGWENHRRLLGALAFGCLERGFRSVTGPELEQLLTAAGAFPAHVEALGRYARSRGGLFRPEIGSRVGFVHQSIQLWLAAWHLVELDQTGPELADYFVSGDRITNEAWREVALLFVGLRREGKGNPVADSAADSARLASFAQSLTDRAMDYAIEPSTRFASATVAVRAIEDNLPGSPLLACRTAAAMLEDDAAMTIGPLADRLHLGAWLTRHGDPRKHVSEVDAMRFCLVPRGRFWMGSDEADQEKPAGWHDIPYDYWMGRYPITNAQFNEFVLDGGYANGDWWTAARHPNAQAWEDGKVLIRYYGYAEESIPVEMARTLEEMMRQERYSEASNFLSDNRLDTLCNRRSSLPGDIMIHQVWVPFLDCVKLYPNHPVAGLSWYEALAFCAWLEARWRSHDWLTPSQHVVLPNEPEWEKAARGGVAIPGQSVIVRAAHIETESDIPVIENPSPRRRYSYGEDFRAECANTLNTGVNHSNATGCFSANWSPYGCQELSGNVWEWTRSLYGLYDYDKRTADCEYRYPYGTRLKVREDASASRDITRVVRGGSWGSNYDFARCAYRNWYLPTDCLDRVGFRVVVAAPVPPLGTM